MKRLLATLPVLSFLFLVACEGSDVLDRGPGALAALFSQGGATAHAGIVAPDSVVAVTRPFPVRTPDGSEFEEPPQAVHGDWLATTDWAEMGDIVVQSLDGSETIRITRNEEPYMPGFGMDPRFSPDGSRVAYTWFDMVEQRADIQVAEIDGGDPVTLFTGGEQRWVDPADWAPDGSEVLARLTREDGTIQLVILPLDGSEPRVLKSLGWSQPRAAAFSPDGRWIAFDFAPRDDARARDIHLISTDGTRGRALLEGSHDEWLLGWAPDGHLLFVSDRGGTPGAWRVAVEDGRMAGPPELVLPDLWRVAPLGFDPEGRFFYIRLTGGPEVRFAGMDPQSGALSGPASPVDPRAVGGTRQPAWSPDGRHLAYVVEHAPFGGGPLSEAAVRIRAMESGEVREFTMPPRAHGIANPRWTPDGRALLLRAQYDRGQTSLLRLDVRTGEVERLLRDVELYPTFELLPGGDRIIHTEALEPEEIEAGDDTPLTGQRLVIRTLDGGEGTELYRHTSRSPNPNLSLWRLAVSPDGAEVAFTRTRMWHGAEDRSADLVVMPIAGGAPRVVLEELDPMGLGALSWSPDGRSLLYLTHPQEEGGRFSTILWRLDLDGGEPQEIGRFDEQIQHVRLHPDGRRVAFGTGYGESELWVLEDLTPVRPRVQASGRD